MFTTTKILDADTSAAARVGWVLVAACALVVAFLPLRGRTIVEYVPVVGNFWAQKITGHDVYRGGVFRMGRHQCLPSFVLPGDLAHLQLIAFEVDGSDGVEVAVIKDPHAKTYTAVLALEGSTFSLLETSVRERPGRCLGVATRPTVRGERGDQPAPGPRTHGPGLR